MTGAAEEARMTLFSKQKKGTVEEINLIQLQRKHVGTVA